MPPWFAVKGFGSFQNDLSASQEDIAVISSWVEGGAPEGDSAFLPPPHKHASEAEDNPNEAGKPSFSIAIESETTLTDEVAATAIRPEDVPEGGGLQAVAHRPDGSIEHLVWVRGFDPRWRRDYVFREPIHLPKGTRIVLSPAEVTATLIGDR